MNTIVLRIDPRRDPPEVEEMNEYMPKEKNVIRKNKLQASYKFDCMNGHEHPLKIEVDNYVLTTVARRTVDTSSFEQMPSEQWHSRFQFSPTEIDFIGSVQEAPEVEWAIDQSFDGLYVHKENDYSRMESIYRFAVYLKEEQATFWKLKFHGR